MVCWYKCCPCYFSPKHPVRLKFKWDLIAMTILTLHDFISLFFCIAAVHKTKDDGTHHGEPYDPAKYPLHKEQFPPLPCSKGGLVALILWQNVHNLIILLLMFEVGFRFMEPGPWLGKLVIAALHVAPAVTYGSTITWKNFVYYEPLGGFGINEAMYPKVVKDTKHKYSTLDYFFHVYGFAAFHHMYVVLFETVMTIIMLIFCSGPPKEMPTLPHEEHLVIEKMAPVEEKPLPQGGAIKIELASPSRNFQPGSTIKGTVSIVSAESEDGTPAAASALSSVTVTIRGHIVVRWNDNRCGKPPIPHDENENFLNESSNSPEFEFMIPANAPPSFRVGDAALDKGKGCIYYYLEVVPQLKGEGTSEPVVIEFPFTVNALQTVGTPPPPNHELFEMEKNIGGILGILPYKNGPCAVQVELPKITFMVGEDISFNVDIVNDCRRPIVKACAAVVSSVLLAQERAGRVEKVWATTESFGSLAVVNKWHANLRLPKGIPESKSLPLCPAIVFENYFFRFTLELAGMTDEMKLEVPIYIGAPPQDQQGEGSRVEIVSATNVGDPSRAPLLGLNNPESPPATDSSTT